MAVTAGFTADAVQFNCRFSFISIDFVGIVYTCDATVILSGSTTLGNVTGAHQKGYTNDDVEFIQIGNQNLSFFPRGIVNRFKNLKSLNYYKNSLLSISAQDLRPYSKLIDLSFHGNNLTSLDGDLFTFTPLLKYLDLGRNQIQHIGENLLSNLGNLQILYLQDNICINSGTRTRDGVLEIIAQLSVLCPPVDAKTTVAIDTEKSIKQCSDNKEIQELRYLITQQSNNIEHLQLSIGQLIQVNKKLQQSSDQLMQANDRCLE